MIRFPRSVIGSVDGSNGDYSAREFRLFTILWLKSRLWLQ
ncbi:hypothetical protein D777_02864 [Marinobacter nitratireducens]|uniref:Uncharacterized protein n=1 Tax=Marinobacter nitratireducens TaxID=1137280 RepID=A0A072N113_9GAMM|nr:hypothetical protein D777_02864 [Marinobacter nitratireducens]